MDVVWLIIALLLVLAGSYYATKLIARFSMGRGFSASPAKFKLGKHISLLDRLIIDKDKSILFIQCDEKRYLVCASAQGFLLLETLEGPFGEEAVSLPAESRGFKDTMNDFLSRLRNKQDK